MHGAPCPSTGETKSSVMVDTAKRNAARLAPLLCSERISPLLCRCFFLLFLGRRGRRRRLLACASSDGDQTLSEGTAAHLHLVFSRCLHPFSPLFDATTIAHNARPPGDAIEAVISHSKSGRCEAAGQRTTRRGDAFGAYRRVRGGAAQHGPATTLPLPT